ncbi:hypothetical protein DICVIV_09865 [Dictyocaulus viviparus]|uniref:Transmembrane protein 234 n=1 Tax=Dictyocaulus viviparus TaxID=29172 RepID=A0A0D8XK37_DICVI|nr:hypothetical protein DICVIV_09865 [Dictyocaulus viviparus]
MTVFTGISLECVVAVLIVGFLWGATNPFLRLGSMCSFNEECEASVNNNAIRNNTWNQMLSPIFDLAKLFSSWKFLIPFVVNQSASVNEYLPLVVV